MGAKGRLVLWVGDEKILPTQTYIDYPEKTIGTPMYIHRAAGLALPEQLLLHFSGL